MAPEATGLARMAKPITNTMIATPASASTMGSAGGRLHLGLSNSSVMGTWPASGWAAGVFDGVVGGWGASGMLGCLLKRESYAGKRFVAKEERRNRRNRASSPSSRVIAVIARDRASEFCRTSSVLFFCNLGSREAGESNIATIQTELPFGNMDPSLPLRDFRKEPMTAMTAMTCDHGDVLPLRMARANSFTGTVFKTSALVSQARRIWRTP